MDNGKFSDVPETHATCEAMEGGPMEFLKEQAMQLGNACLEEAVGKAAESFTENIENEQIKEMLQENICNLQQEIKSVSTEVRMYLNEEISRAELMQSLTEKTAEFVSMVVRPIAMAIATEEGMGATAPVIGNIAAYAAGNLIRQAVAPFINAAKEVEWAKERYEYIHEMSEQSIKQMIEQRQIFEQETARIFGDRKKLIEESLDQIDNALKQNDVNKTSAALNNISKEFGKSNKLNTFEEFDDFLMNGEEEITW